MHLKLEVLMVHCTQSFEFCNALGQVCGYASFLCHLKLFFKKKRAARYP